MIFPQDSVAAEETLARGLDMRIDRDAGRITDEAADERESLENFIEKAIKTRSGRYAAYDGGFGLKIKDVSDAAELQAAIKDALLSDERILAVNVTGMSRSGSEVHIGLDVKSIYGDMDITVSEVTE